MPRLLPFDALHGPQTRARWTAILAAALALIAVPAYQLTADPAPGSLTQETAGFAWGADQIQAGRGEPGTRLGDHLGGGALEGATLSAEVDGMPLVVEAAWDPDITVTQIRVETYTDLHGSGLRIGATAWADTEPATRCLAVAVIGDPTTTAGDSTVKLCTRTDLQLQSDTYPGRGQQPDWEPAHLFLTQTAELIPTASGPLLIDHFAIGASTGDPAESGIWGPNWWQPMDYGDDLDLWRWSCGQSETVVDLTDDPAYGDRFALPLAHTEPPPLPIPACVPITSRIGSAGFATAPFTAGGTVPLSGWARFNDVTGTPRPLQVAVTADLRTCDAEPDRCRTDTAARWQSELLDPDW